MSSRLLPAILFLLVSVSVPAQTGGDGRSAFLERKRSEARSYHDARRDERGGFLRRSWIAASPSAPREDPFRRGDAGRPPGGGSAGKEEPAGDCLPAPQTLQTEEVISGGRFPFRYYGKTYRVRYDPGMDVSLKGISGEDVASGWELLSGKASALLEDCKVIRERERLCDWAFLHLVDSLSAAVCPADGDGRELLLGFLLGGSGYRVRFAHSEEGLCCLYATEQVIYERPYFEKDGAYYYRHREGNGPLSLSEPVPGGMRPLDLRLREAPAFEGGPLLSRHIRVGEIVFDYRVPEALLSFYGSYPHTEMYVKAGAPAGRWLRESAYPSLREAVRGKGEVEASGVLLGFVQGVMTYQRDEERWGREKWNFPEESLWYLTGDCDDHAILFARLVRDIMGVEVLLVECRVGGGASHVATALRLDGPLEGDTISYGGRTWYCCEPTSNRARVGERCWESYVVTRVDEVD